MLQLRHGHHRLLCGWPLNGPLIPSLAQAREDRGQHNGGGLGGGGAGRDALERKGHQRAPQRRLGRRLEEVAKAVGGGHCRLQMPLKLALGRQGDSGWA